MDTTPSDPSDRERVYPVRDDVTLHLLPPEDTGQIKLWVLRNDEILHAESHAPVELFSSTWWSENNPERIAEEVAESLTTTDDSSLAKGLRSAFFEAGIDFRSEGTGPPEKKWGEYTTEKCAPPQRDSVSVDVDARRDEIEETRYEDWLETENLTIWGDAPGIGKTTSTAKGAVALDRPHIVYLPTHENAWEFQNDDDKPDGYFHLKGPEQPREDECMAAKVHDRQCEDHNERSECPRMCPIYNLDEDDPTRLAYERLANEIGPGAAHRELNLTEDEGHYCEWRNQFIIIEHRQRIVTVQNYLTLPNSRRTGEDDVTRDNIVDDCQGLLDDGRHLGGQELKHVSHELEQLEPKDDFNTVVQNIATFVDDIVDTLQSKEPDEDPDELSLAELESPTVEIPDWVTARTSDEDDRLAETLAWAKYAYNERIINQLKADSWNGAPLCMDAIFAAAAEAGLSGESVRRAIAAQPSFNQCPRCGESKESDQTGGYECDECGWDESEDALLEDDEPVRAIAWIGADPEDDDMSPPPVLGYRELPLLSELPEPENTLILDATPTPEIYTSLFGVSTDAVTVEGNEPVEITAHVTQIIDGQYHESTIDRPESDKQSRIQEVIDRRCDRFSDVLVVGHKETRRLYDLPENAEWMHFYAGRGLDRSDFNAVIVIGAPHPNERGLRREARLLATGRDDVRVGGTEYGTRRNEDGDITAEPPVYRKYNYADDTGVGRAVPTKAYSGMMGTLFEDKREKELVQLAHRIRPVLATYPKYIDILTNVPTDLPIDTLATFSELTGPLYEALSIENSDGAIRLLQHICDALDDDDPAPLTIRDDGAVANTRSELHEFALDRGEDVTKRTVDNWVDCLVDLGLFIETDEYKFRAGQIFRANPATLRKALKILTYRGYFEPGTTRLLRAEIEEADGTLDWLELADKGVGFPLEVVRGYQEG